MERSWLKLDQVQRVLEKIHQYEAVVEDWKDQYESYCEELINPLSWRLGQIEERLNNLFVKIEMRDAVSEHGKFLETDERFQEEEALSKSLEEDIIEFDADFQNATNFLENPHAGEIKKREYIILHLQQEVTAVRRQVVIEQQLSNTRNRSRFVFRKRMHIGRKRNLQLSRENVLLRCKLRVATKKLGDLKQKNQNLEVQFIDAEKACEDLHTCWNQDSKEFQEEREDLLSTINTKDDTICQLEEDSSSLYAQIQQMREEEVHANKESQDVCHQLKNLYKVSQTNEGFIKRSEAGITDLKQQSVSLHLENDSLKHENNQLRIDAKKLREKLRAATSPKVQPSPEQGLSNLSLQGNDSDSDSGLDTNEDDTDTHTSRPRNFGLDQRARSRSNRSTSNATASASRQNPVSSERRRVYSAVKKLTDHQLSLLEPDISGVSRIIPGEGYHWVSGHTRMNPKNRPPGLEDDTSKLETKQRRLS